MSWQILIDDEDITSNVRKCEIKKTFGQFSTELTMEAIDLPETIDNNSNVIVYRNNVKIFDGYITYLEVKYMKYNITAYDKIILLNRVEINKTYTNTDSTGGVVSEIFKDVVLQAGLNADDDSIQLSEYTLKEYKCKHIKAFDVCKKLAELLDWQFYYDAETDKVYFEPKGFVYVDNEFKVGEEIIEVPVWKYDDSEVINDLTIIGSPINVSTTQYFNGNGSNKVFTLQYQPNVSVEVYVNGVLKKGGIKSSSSSYDYTVDIENRSITFVSAPPSGTNNVQVKYTYSVPVSCRIRNSESIEKYGLRQMTLYYPEILTIEDAEIKCSNLIQKFSNPFKRVSLKILDAPINDVNIGRRIHIIDEVNGEDDYLMISKITISYPLPYDIVESGDREWRLGDWGSRVEERIKRLENEMSLSTEINHQIETMNLNISLLPYSITISKRGLKDNYLILGHINPNKRKTGYGSKLGNSRNNYSDVYNETYV